MSSLIAQENYSFMKLLIENDKEEILLVKWEGEWELPGEKFNKPIPINSFLIEMAETTGATIENPILFGLYTQKWRNADYLTLMHYYMAKYKSGDIKIPPDCTDIRWFSQEEALSRIPYENMKFMIKWKEKHPGKIASAAFEKFRDENKNVKYIAIENWHKIN